MSKLPRQYRRLYGRWVGEFVVIVLGILAALAVDSWSEDHKNRVLEQEYLGRIKEELKWDLAEIEEAVKASILQARAATSLLYELNDPLADHVPRFGSARLKAIDFTVPVNEELGVPLKRLLWWVARTRTFDPRRSAYDELLATGRIVVIDDSELRASILDHYAFTEDTVLGLAEWVREPADDYDRFLATSTGFNAYDFNAIDDPITLLRDLDGVLPKLRDVRRISLRQAMTLESVEESSRELLAIIDSHLHN